MRPGFMIFELLIYLSATMLLIVFSVTLINMVFFTTKNHLKITQASVELPVALNHLSQAISTQSCDLSVWKYSNNEIMCAQGKKAYTWKLNKNNLTQYVQEGAIRSTSILARDIASLKFVITKNSLGNIKLLTICSKHNFLPASFLLSISPRIGAVL